MRLLGRLLGRDESDGVPSDDSSPAVTDAEIEAEEHAQTIAILAAEQERLDEFRLRQLRWARYAWRPPAQGGTRRADDGVDATADAEDDPAEG